jgi:cytochrome c oxidase cbb3-type subunit III
MGIRRTLAGTALAALAVFAGHAGAQGTPQAPPPAGAPQTQPPQAPQTPPGGRGQGRGRAEFPAQQRELADPAVVEKGKTLYEINCRACHGADLRGGDIGGPNLLRSQLVLNDQHGELIVPVVKSGRMNPGMPVMPPLPLPEEDVKAIAEYIHSVTATMQRQGSPPPGAEVELNILVGDAKAGQAYFAAKCSSCHSPTGDLKGLAEKISSPLALQNHWITGGGGGRGGRSGGAGNADRKPVMVTVTPASGAKVEGRLERIDDFIVVLTTADGMQRSFTRNGDVPKVEIQDPLEGHRKLLTVYTDKDIHDVTAYLVTLK